MEEKLAFEEFLVRLEPVGSSEISLKKLDRTALKEYVRVYEYQQLLTTFEKNYPNLQYQLWIWINNIINDKNYFDDPIFFLDEDEKVNYADLLLLGDRNLVLAQKENVKQAIDDMKKQLTELIKEKADYKLKVSVGENEITLRRKGMSFYGVPSLLLDNGDYQYLRDLIDSSIEEEVANRLIEIYLLRYSLIENNIQTSILPVPYYQELNKLDVKAQLFATPLNHQFDAYGSEFFDIDSFFGSFGSIMKDENALKFVKQGGAFEVNLISYGPFHGGIVKKLNEILISSKKKITFFVVHDLTTNSDQHSDLTTHVRNSTYLPRIASNGEGVVHTRNFLVLQSEKATLIGEKDFLRIFRILSEESINDRHRYKTLPILTPYEKAKAVGIRAMDLGTKGATPQIKVPEGVVDVLTVAEMELEQKKMPMLVSRPDGDWDINTLEDYDSGNYLYDMGPSSVVF